MLKVYDLIVVASCAGLRAGGAAASSLAEPVGQGSMQPSLQDRSFPLVFDNQALQQVTSNPRINTYKPKGLNADICNCKHTGQPH